MLRRLFFLLLLLPVMAQAERVRDVADMEGVRGNALVGYGMIVGLDGTGDKAPLASQSLANMLGQLGVQTGGVASKNAAAVIVTAELPAFARPGQKLDVTVSSLADAKSLRGGTLLLTPLKGLDGKVYAVAQGNVVVAGAGAGGTQINHLSAGRVPSGGVVERAPPQPVQSAATLDFALKRQDFTAVRQMVVAINAAKGEGTAWALDGRTVRVATPGDSDARVAFLADILELPVTGARPSPKVTINARTGSISMNQSVELEPCAISHGNLTVTVTKTPQVSQPAPLSQGKTVATEQASAEIKADPGRVLNLPQAANLAEVVKALNSIGATPQDLVAILQAMKANGALRAELEII